MNLVDQVTNLGFHWLVLIILYPHTLNVTTCQMHLCYSMFCPAFIYWVTL